MGESGPLAQAWRDDHGHPDDAQLDPGWLEAFARLSSDLTDLRLAVSCLIPDDGECPWCALGFDPCVCEQDWLTPAAEAMETLAEKPTDIYIAPTPEPQP